MENKKNNSKAKRTLINLLITVIFALFYYYFALPAFNLQDPKFYSFIFLIAAIYCFLSILTQGLFKATSGKEFWHSVKTHCTVPLYICIALAAIYIVGNLVSAPIFRAGAYSRLLTVETGDFSTDVDEISYDQIPMLDADSARKLGDKKMGELSDMVSQFEVADDYTQINVSGTPVRVTPLRYGDFFKWLSNRSEGLPAYIVIDMVTQDVEAVRLDEGMKYTTTEYFFRNVQRHLRYLYPTYIFDEPCFEIDDSGTPYWICPRIVKRIGLFGGTDIQGAVLMNAITGECVYYEDVPSWVDRVYTADLIIEQYDYYGTYINGWLNSFIGQKGVTVTTEGYNYIAIGDDVYLYTGITSVASDDSNVGFILSNQRTKETKYYACAGAIEYSAMASAEGIVQYMDYDATFPLLLNISGQPTYFMALKDTEGLVKMYAMVNVQQYQLVASGTSLAACEASYNELLESNGILQPSVDESESESDAKQISGIVAEIRTAVIDGNTHVFLRLEGSDCFYVVSVADSEIAAVLNQGDAVTIYSSDEEGELRSAYRVEK